MRFADYEGPGAGYIATGGRIIPFNTAEGIAAFAHSAVLSSLGVGDRADAYGRGMTLALEEARRSDIRAVEAGD